MRAVGLSVSDVRVEFLSAMARALSAYGENADDLEQDLTDCARSLGLRAQFFATPTAVMASFREGDDEHTRLLRITEARIDLQALSLVRGVLSGVTAGTTGVEPGLAELKLIRASPPRFPWYMRVLASGLGAASFAIFLGGAFTAFVAALPVGLAVGALVVVAQRYRRLTPLMELLAALLAAFVAIAVGHVFGHFSLPTVTLAGVILLLPGLAITIGVAELASRHLSSGTSRLAGATVTLVNLGVGSFLGFALAKRLDLVPHMGVVERSPGTMTIVAAILINAVALVVATNTRVRDYPYTLAAVVVAFLGARFGAWLVGAALGVTVASLLVGLGSNAFARLRHRPASLTLIPGLAVLVPGALGLRGVSEFLRTASGGVAVLVSVLTIAAGIVVGLMIADATLPPRRGRTFVD
jgi:uncharacterized membrane protein YjjP (DUF1212 family)